MTAAHVIMGMFIDYLYFLSTKYILGKILGSQTGLAAIHQDIWYANRLKLSTNSSMKRRLPFPNPALTKAAAIGSD